jgi:hypothetical protein
MKRRSKQIVVLSTTIILFVSGLLAQPAQTLIEVNIAPEKSNWVYKPNEKAKFNLSAYLHVCCLQRDHGSENPFLC